MTSAVVDFRERAIETGVRESPLFHLTGPWAWTNEASNAMSTWIVILTKGNASTYVNSDASKKRALCVLGS